MNIMAQNGNPSSSTAKASASKAKTVELLDPNLLRSARKIYNNYRHYHTKMSRSPIGVAIDRNTYRGQLLFTKRPVLLPCEHFVPISQLES